MLSINTNLSSLIVQQNLAQSTSALNTAIERMTTGYKINHASDNAAGYSIAENMSSKLSSYMVAQDNISAGMDLIATAQDTISLMQSHGERIHALITQAHNGTYGASSLSAIQSEVNARLAEITRLYNTTEYNGIDLLKIPLPDWAEEVKANAGAGINEGVSNVYGDFIADPRARDGEGNLIDVDSLTSVAGLSDFSSKSQYKITSKAELEHFRDLVNEGKSTSGKSFYLAADIDLESEEWTAIGTSSKKFNGIFDGNGHKITNLKINNETKNYQGLFGYAGSGSTIKNVGIEGANVTGRNYVGALVASASGSITNSYATGSVTGLCSTGGLVGGTSGNITNSYATGNVRGNSDTGGLVGYAYSNSTITNSYATGNVSGNDNTGGLVGVACGSITNSYATGSVSGTTAVGGLIGRVEYAYYDYATLENVFSGGMVSGQDAVGSLIGGLYYNDYGDEEGTLTITNASTALQNGINVLGAGMYCDDDGDHIDYDYDMTEYLENITVTASTSTTLQVGINGDTSSQITFGTKLNMNLNISNVKSNNAYDSINAFLESLSARATELGAISNRLESALESTSVQIDNLTSSRSTIKDSDIAQVSSEYIRHQILQQASATLLATANQSPSIALQLI